jgi:hypothetical protein
MANCLAVAAFVFLMLLIIILSFSEKDSYERVPTSYYDQGGWIEGPPLLGNWGYVNEYPEQPISNSPKVPRSSSNSLLNPNVESGFRDLCDECINECRTEISLGQTHPKPGEKIPGYCSKKCRLVCP